jgi:molybdopterin molybdotransferase
MISVKEARAHILANAQPMGAESIPLEVAFGRTLAESIVATRAQPPFAASAMDGYAVRAADTPGTLALIGEAGAGRALSCALGAGEAARIFTGAPVPEGADAIVIQEDATRADDRVTAPRVEAGTHVRGAGGDFVAGAVLLKPGRLLDGPALTLAAAAGRAHVRAARAPRVAILTGGDEIVPPGVTPGPTQIFDSISAGLAGLVAGWGAAATISAPFADDRAKIAARLETAIGGFDLTIVVGGASVGEHDHARAALTMAGADLLFAGVAVRPGKPTWLARRGGHVVLGLPGNPASALVCARLFLRPLLERMLGRDDTLSLTTTNARLRRALAANGPRETYWRAMHEVDDDGQCWVTPFTQQDSSLVSVLAAADALIVQAPHDGARAAGGRVPILAL